MSLKRGSSIPVLPKIGSSTRLQSPAADIAVSHDQPGSGSVGSAIGTHSRSFRGSASKSRKSLAFDQQSKSSPVAHARRGLAGDDGASSNVHVAIRVRPLLGPKRDRSCLEVQSGQQSSILVGGSRRFTFDVVLAPQTAQVVAYEQCARPLLGAALSGYHATIFAYGQTGSGKTYTMGSGSAASRRPSKRRLIASHSGRVAPSGTAAGIGPEDIDQHVDSDSEASTTEGAAEGGDGDPETLAEQEAAQDLEDDAGIIPRFLHELFDRLSEEAMEEINKNATKEGATRAGGEAGGGGGGEKGFADDSADGQTQMEMSSSTTSFEVRVSMVEVYGEIVRDLLQPASDSSAPSWHATGQQAEVGLSLREGPSGVEVVGLQAQEVSSAREALEYLEQGVLRRATGATKMNVHSSRSHAIYTLELEKRTVTHAPPAPRAESAGAASGAGEDLTGDSGPLVEVRHSKVHFVDLAGSERQKKTKAKGVRMKEGIAINKGLLALGNVISALGDEKKRKSISHVPYRDSKLTRLLQDALGGNSRTAMIACVSPAATSLEETLNTLRYANRAKNIQNKARVNIDPKAGVITALRAEIALLRAQLEQSPAAIPRPLGHEGGSEDSSEPSEEGSGERLSRRGKTEAEKVSPATTLTADQLAAQATLTTLVRSLGAHSHDELAGIVGDLLADREKLALVQEVADDLKSRLDSRASLVARLERSCESARDCLAGAIKATSSTHDVDSATRVAQQLFEAAVDAESMIENVLTGAAAASPAADSPTAHQLAATPDQADAGEFVFLSEDALRAIREIGDARMGPSTVVKRDKRAEVVGGAGTPTAASTSPDASGAIAGNDGDAAIPVAGSKADVDDVDAETTTEKAIGASDLADTSSVDLMQQEEWNNRANELQSDLVRLEHDIRSKEELEDALIQKGREVMLMRARVADLYEQIKAVTEDRDALAEALEQQQEAGHSGPLPQVPLSSSIEPTEAVMVSKASVETEERLAAAEQKLQDLLEQRVALEEQLRSAAESARDLHRLRAELDALRRQYALSVTMVSKLRRENQRTVASRDTEINALRKSLNRTKLQLQRLRGDYERREAVHKQKAEQLSAVRRKLKVGRSTLRLSLAGARKVKPPKPTLSFKHAAPAEGAPAMHPLVLQTRVASSTLAPADIEEQSPMKLSELELAVQEAIDEHLAKTQSSHETTELRQQRNSAKARCNALEAREFLLESAIAESEVTSDGANAPRTSEDGNSDKEEDEERSDRLDALLSEAIEQALRHDDAYGAGRLSSRSSEVLVASATQLSTSFSLDELYAAKQQNQETLEGAKARLIYQEDALTRAQQPVVIASSHGAAGEQVGGSYLPNSEAEQVLLKVAIHHKADAVAAAAQAELLATAVDAAQNEVDETNAALRAAREEAAAARSQLASVRAATADAARRDRLAKLLGFSHDEQTHVAKVSDGAPQIPTEASIDTGASAPATARSPSAQELTEVTRLLGQYKQRQRQLSGANARLRRQVERSDREVARLRERVRSLTKQMLAAGVMHSEMPPGIGRSGPPGSKKMKRRQTMMPSSPRRQSGALLVAGRDSQTDYDIGLRQIRSRDKGELQSAPKPPSSVAVATMARAAADKKLEERSRRGSMGTSSNGRHTPTRLDREARSVSGSSKESKSSSSKKRWEGSRHYPESRVPSIPWRSTGRATPRDRDPDPSVGFSAASSTAIGPRSKTPPRWEFSLRKEAGDVSRAQQGGADHHSSSIGSTNPTAANPAHRFSSSPLKSSPYQTGDVTSRRDQVHSMRGGLPAAVLAAMGTRSVAPPEPPTEVGSVASPPGLARRPKPSAAQVLMQRKRKQDKPREKNQTADSIDTSKRAERAIVEGAAAGDDEESGAPLTVRGASLRVKPRSPLRTIAEDAGPHRVEESTDSRPPPASSGGVAYPVGRAARLLAQRKQQARGSARPGSPN